MNGCMVNVIRPHLHHVPGVDHERSLDRWNIVPDPVFVDLQTAYLILQQDRQRAGVRMVVNTEVSIPHVCNILAAVKRIFYRIIIQANKARVPRLEI